MWACASVIVMSTDERGHAGSFGTVSFCSEDKKKKHIQVFIIYSMCILLMMTNKLLVTQIILSKNTS